MFVFDVYFYEKVEMAFADDYENLSYIVTVNTPTDLTNKEIVDLALERYKDLKFRFPYSAVVKEREYELQL